MSVYIPGMEMPTEGTVIAIYKLDGKFYASVHGTELCPLIPVPEHGRLIEAGAIKNRIANCIYDDAFARGWNAAMKRILEAAEDAPTIIPAEEGET